MKTIKTLRFLPIFLLLLSITTIITSCEKDELDKLPAETMSGRNTFGCLINGEAFLPNKPRWTSRPLEGTFINNTKLFGIQAINDDYSIIIEISEPKTDLVYRFNRNFLNDENKSTIITYCPLGPGDIGLDTNAMNVLTFTKFDLEHKIASGTFNLEFTGDNCSEGNYIISEGRFDLLFDIF